MLSAYLRLTALTQILWPVLPFFFDRALLAPSYFLILHPVAIFHMVNLLQCCPLIIKLSHSKFEGQLNLVKHQKIHSAMLVL